MTPSPTDSIFERLSTDLADWCVSEASLPYCDHIVSWSDRVILVDPSLHGDVPWILAHCFAHVDHEHGHAGEVDTPLTPQECLDMDGVARMALGLDVLGLGGGGQDSRLRTTAP